MNKFNNCLITGANDLKSLRGYEANFLVKSKSSGFVFCSKAPSEQELIEHYSKYPIGYNDNSELNRKRYNERLDEFEKFRTNNRILDVGCGNGMLLEEAKKRGWKVYGTEFTDNQISYLISKGISAYQGRLNPSAFDNDFFDVIISSEVIEHINNPLEEMSCFYKFLRRGGLVYITTPNFNAIERFILKNNYEVIEYPEHLCYYTPKTLNLLMKTVGFKKLKVTTTGISIDKIKRGKSKQKPTYSNNTELSDEKIRASLENGFKKYIKNFFNTILNITGTGNSLKGWYIKP
jgi:2-polyprenyl-3-methyl-5-hydroxy-6-metoxy-1,4-benzoquinol methylase